MAAKSNHYGDVYNWIVSIINSCNKIEQQPVINKLIRSYYRTYRIDHIDFSRLAENQKFEDSLLEQVKNLYALSREKFLALLLDKSAL